MDWLKEMVWHIYSTMSIAQLPYFIIFHYTYRTSPWLKFFPFSYFLIWIYLINCCTLKEKVKMLFIWTPLLFWTQLVEADETKEISHIWMGNILHLGKLQTSNISDFAMKSGYFTHQRTLSVVPNTNATHIRSMTLRFFKEKLQY